MSDFVHLHVHTEYSPLDAPVALGKLKAARDDEVLKASLARLEVDARGDSPLMPAIVACVEASATVGEICATLESIFGRYRSRSV